MWNVAWLEEAENAMRIRQIKVEREPVRLRYVEVWRAAGLP